MGHADAMDQSLRRHPRQERGGLDRVHAQRPRGAAQYQERRFHRVPAAAHDQHPPRVRRQLDHAGDVLGRQQSRRLDHQARAAGLSLPMPPMPIDFWFSIGSMYTFLTVMRIDRVEDTTDVRFVWRPFSVKAIMIEMDNRPMSKAKNLAYMWRDLHRRAEMYGFAFEGEAPYPLQNFDLANRVAIVGAEEGWCADYVRAT